MVGSPPSPSESRLLALPPRLLPILYFGAAHLFLLAAFTCILLDPGRLTGFFYQPSTAAIVHLVALGWISLSILGAIYAIGPMALRMPMPARGADYVAFGSTVVGITGMAAHFSIAEYGGMTWSAGMVVLGVLHVAARTLRGLRSAPVEPPVKVHIILAFVNLLAAATIGILVGLHKQQPFLSGSVLSIVYGHAHLAGLGWASMMVMGVGYRLLPMVLPSAIPRGPGLYVSAIALGVGVAGLLPAFLAGGRWLPLFALFALAGFAAFFLKIRWMVAHRRRPPAGMPRPDYGARHAFIALAYAALTASLGLTLSVAPVSDATSRTAAAYGTLGLLGFLSQMVVGIEARVLPMLAAYHANLNACSVRPPVRPYQMPDRRLQAATFYLWTAGVPLLAGGIFLEVAGVLGTGALILLVGTALGAINAAIVVRHAFIALSPRDPGGSG